MADEQIVETLDRAELRVKTDWANPPKLEDLKQDYMDAANHHNNHVTQVNTWLDNLNVTGAAKPKFRKGRSQIVPKLIRKQAEWRYAALSESFLSHENLFTTEPVTFEDRDAAEQNGLVINNQFNTKLDKVAFIDEYVRAGVDEGSIIVRVGWDFQEEEIEVENLVPTPITNQFHKDMVEQAAGLMMQDPEGASQQLPPELLQTAQLSLEMGELVELKVDPDEPTRKEKRTILNQPTVEVTDFSSTIIDPTCKGILDNAAFIIHKFETSKSDLEKDGRYVNLDHINIERNAIQNAETDTEQSEDTGSFNFKDKPRKKFDVFEYWGFWDIDNTGMTVAFVSAWVGDVMIRLERSPFPDGKLPFVLIPYLPKRKSVYGEPDGSLLEDNQKIAGAVTRGMIDMMGRSAVGQIGYRKDALDVTNLRKFEAGTDYSFNANIDPQMAFHTHKFPEIPQSAQFMLQLQNNEAESLTGVKAFHGGISGEGLGRSATAARSAIDAAGKRELGILRRLASGVVQIGRKVMAMNAVFLSEEEIIRITNEEFVTIKRDDLQGKVDIKLKISTAEADDTKAQELAFMLQTTGPNSDPAEVRMIRAEIAKLRKMPELAKRIEEFQPQPDPLAVKKAELEIELLVAEIDKTKSEAEENRAEAQLDRSQASKADSERDLKDLEFVETESGVTQERAKEVVGEQARANENLEVTKAILSPESGNTQSGQPTQ